MSRRDWVAYVGPFAFPWGEPNSRRVYGVARSLAAAGRDVVVAAGQAGPTTATRLEEVTGPATVSYVGLGEAPPPGAGRLADLWAFVRWGRRTVTWLEAQPTRPSHVLVNGGMAQYMVHLRRWCRRHGVPLVADVVDWYNGRYVRGGVLGPLHLSMKAALRYHYPRCDAVIAISSHLEGYYRARGTPALRVPPTLDVRGLAIQRDGHDADAPDLVLAYAGNPCRDRKDLLTTIIAAADRVEREGARIALRVYGPSRREVCQLLGRDAPPRCVQTLGRLPQPAMPRALQAADFSVLVRRPELASQAGFSTKFCESLANGTPVVANLTSDMGRYLRDGAEGLVCAGHSVDELAATLRSALHLTDDERERMRAAARRRAMESFDFRVYAEPLGALLDTVRR
jgi:glycosyltransferase involved in cell wall biosynthesis